MCGAASLLYGELSCVSLTVSQLLILLLLGGATGLPASSGACRGVCCLCKLGVGKQPLHGNLHMVGILQGGRGGGIRTEGA